MIIIFGVKGIRWLKSLKLNDNDQILLHEYILQIEFLNTEIKNIESKITCETSKNESVKKLMSMTGIHYFSAITSEIERFSTPLFNRKVMVSFEFKKTKCYQVFGV